MFFYCLALWKNTVINWTSCIYCEGPKSPYTTLHHFTHFINLNTPQYQYLITFIPNRCYTLLTKVNYWQLTFQSTWVCFHINQARVHWGEDVFIVGTGISSTNTQWILEYYPSVRLCAQTVSQHSSIRQAAPLHNHHTVSQVIPGLD